MRWRRISIGTFLVVLALAVGLAAPAHARDCPERVGLPGGGGLGGQQPLMHIALAGCGGGGGSPQPPAPVCWLDETETTGDCATAAVNDYCDSDPEDPFDAYLRDSVWDGGSCLECTAQEQACGQGIDTDCDGRIDCADPDCFADGTCTFHEWGNSCGAILDGIDYGSYELDCYDGLDNDGDGHVDCLDTDCIYGTDCPPLGDADCDCPDYDVDGQIYQDWGDVASVFGTRYFEAAYRCAQIYDPYCSDPETRDFLGWMRDKDYAGRVIAIHAMDANDPVKRSLGNAAHFQRYYDIRNNDPYGSGSYPYQLQAFKEDSIFEIEFIQIVPTDPEIAPNLIPEQEVDAQLLPYFQDQIWGRPIDFVYSEVPVSFYQAFGAPGPCPTNPDWACFDESAMGAWLVPQLANRIYIVHWGALELTDGTPIRNNRICQTCMEGNRTLPAMQVLAAHEFGHFLILPHPLPNIPYVFAENPRDMIGTGGIMAWLGYVYGTAERNSPLGRYALEPVAGYTDEATFGPTFSAETLVCND